MEQITSGITGEEEENEQWKNLWSLRQNQWRYLWS
jgi:hypothetical protein